MDAVVARFLEQIQDADVSEDATLAGMSKAELGRLLVERIADQTEAQRAGQPTHAIEHSIALIRKQLQAE